MRYGALGHRQYLKAASENRVRWLLQRLGELLKVKLVVSVLVKPRHDAGCRELNLPHTRLAVQLLLYREQEPELGCIQESIVVDVE